MSGIVRKMSLIHEADHMISFNISEKLMQIFMYYLIKYSLYPIHLGKFQKECVIKIYHTGINVYSTDSYIVQIQSIIMKVYGSFLLIMPLYIKIWALYFR